MKKPTQARQTRTVSRIAGNKKRVFVKKSMSSVVTVSKAPEVRAEELVKLFDQVPCVLFSLAVEAKGRFRFTSANIAFFEVTGLTRDQVIGRLVQDVIPEPSCTMVLRKYREAIRSGKSVQWEETSVYPVGERHGEVVVTPVADAEGRVTHLAGVVHDITSRKRAETATHQVESRLRQTLAFSPLIVWHQDKDLRYTWIHNPNLGFKHEDVLGKTDADLLPAEEAALLTRIKRRVLKTGVPAREEVKATVGGKAFYYDLSVDPSRSGRGRICGIAGVAMDITERKETEEALRRTEALLRGAFDNAPFEFWVRDREGRCILQNQAIVRHWGDLLGNRPEDAAIAPETLAIWENNNRRAYAGEVVTGEVKFVQSNGTVRWFSNIVAPFRVGDQILGVLGFNIDITERKQAEDALRESEARYARAVRGTNEGLWEWNIVTNETYLSPRWKALLGFATDELPDDRLISFYSRLHPDDVERVKAASRENLVRLVPYEVQVRLRMKSGEYRWFHVRGQAEGDEQGKPVVIAGAMSDITENKCTEEALRENEERMRAVFEQAAVGVATVDMVTGRFLEVNQRYCDIAGRTHEQMLELRFQDITHPDDLRANLQIHKKLRMGQIPEFMLEKRYLRPDGASIWVNLHASLLSTAGKSPNRFLAIVEDINERKNAEASYRRELEFNETLVNQTSVIIVLLDQEGHMIYVNDATVKILGYSRSELIQRTPREVGIMSLEESARSMERLRRLIKGENNPPREVILTGKNGDAHVVALSSIATRTQDGKIDRIIVTGTDLTERNRLQREILRISEAEQARIGHNLHDGVGQTMTGIANLMEALECELKGKQRTSAARIRELLHQGILEVRRMSHSMSPAAVKNRGLGGTLQLLAETIRTNHRTACTCEIEDGIHIEDTEKATHIYRIAQEAANNAIRHGKPSQIQISLRHFNAGQCVLKIEDNGSGLAKSKSKASDGIGLQVMDYRANLIGGSFNITSKPGGRGVIVTCRFPCESPVLPPSSRPSAAPFKKVAQVSNGDFGGGI